MRRAPFVVITPEKEAAICYEGRWELVGKHAPLSIPAPADGEMLFTVTALMSEKGRIPVPILHRIAFNEGRPTASTLPAVDWGDVVAVSPEPVFIEPESGSEIGILDTAEFVYKGRRAQAELFYDGGLRLSLTPRGGEPAFFSLGAGERGSLKSLDTGGGLMLIVTCASGDGERLLAISGSAETVLDVSAEKASLEEGCPTAIFPLGTYSGLEKRVRYELRGGKYSVLESKTGYFTHEKRVPESCVQKAEALLLSLKSGVYAELPELLSNELAERASGEELRAFLGFEGSGSIYPLEEPDGVVTIGITDADKTVSRPNRFRLIFKDGLIDDIGEL